MNMQVVTCPNCNGQVQIDASREFGFCSYCGTKIVFEREAPLNATQAFADNRSAALDEITRIMDHFEPVADDFRRVDAVNDEINFLSHKSYAGVIGAGIVILIIGIIIMLCGGIPVGIAVLIVAIVLFVVPGVQKNNDSKTIEDLKEEKRDLSKLLMDRYNEYPNCPVGIEYCREDVLYDLYEYLRKGRAETIKEAINLLESDEHNAEMMRIAKETREISQKNLEVNTINMLNNLK